MTKAAEAVYDLATRLAPSDRAELISRLYELDDADVQERDPGYDEAWAAELRSRVEAFQRDPTVAVPWQEVVARLRRTAGPWRVSR